MMNNRIKKPTPRMCKGMILASRLVERGELAPDVMVDTLAWARKIRDDETKSERVRMRAAELMAKITDRIVTAGLDLEKLESAAEERDDEFDEFAAEYLDGSTG